MQSIPKGGSQSTGVVIDHVERLKLSANGNPRFRIYFTNGFSAPTQSDNSVGYSVSNYLSIDNRNRPVIVTFTKAGFITDIQFTDGTRA